MSEETGDWYCKNCGYISNARVTFSETCDTCHTPVEWHSVEDEDTLTQLLSHREVLIGSLRARDELLSQKQFVQDCKQQLDDSAKALAFLESLSLGKVEIDLELAKSLVLVIQDLSCRFVGTIDYDPKAAMMLLQKAIEDAELRKRGKEG